MRYTAVGASGGATGAAGSERVAVVERHSATSKKDK
jgi:hypothetical protein